MEKISGGVTDFDDALYLNQEALNALQGSPKGVACSKARGPLPPYGEKELEGGKASDGGVRNRVSVRSS